MAFRVSVVNTNSVSKKKKKSHSLAFVHKFEGEEKNR